MVSLSGVKCSVNILIVELQSTANILKMKLQSGYYFIIFLLSQHVKVGFTECSVKCVIIELQSTLLPMIK